MKSLDERISTMVSPYDEDDTDQGDVLQDQHLQYQKEVIINSIGSKNSKTQFDNHFDEVLEKLPDGVVKSLFIGDCVKKLSDEYGLDVLFDHIQRTELIYTNIDSVINLIKFFVYDHWLNNIVFCLPNLPIETILDQKYIYKLLTESYLSIQNKIIERDDINPLIHFYFTFCSLQNGVMTINKMMMMDISGVISAQAIKRLK